MEIVNVEQRSEEWFKLREKRMTASHARAIGVNGKGLITYVRELMQEYYSIAEKEHFSNKHTDRGNELEPMAGFAYFAKTGNEVEKVGFVIHNDYVGCSPDGFVGIDGLVEIKCPDDKEFFRLLVSDQKPKDIKPEYIWQIQMQMQNTGRLWCDFVAYNPNFAKIKKEIIIIRVLPDQKVFEKLEKGYEIGKQEIMKIEAMMKTN